MYIFEIIIPGTWLDYEDRDWSWEVESQLRSLEGQFFEANLALNLFHSIDRYESTSKDDRLRDTTRRSEIRKQIEAEIIQEGKNYWDYMDEINLKTEVIFKREKWSQGHLPREFNHNLAFLYARAFLYALDTFDKFLKVLSNYERAPIEVKNAYQKMTEYFPNLRGVRNTVQHLEDRSRKLGGGRNPKPLDLKPVDNGFINAPNGALILNCLNGSKYGSTMADGHYGEVDVSPESMNHLQTILTEVANSFKWKGSPQHKPSM